LGYVKVLRERAERHAAVADLFYGLIMGAKSIEEAGRCALLNRLDTREGYENTEGVAADPTRMEGFAVGLGLGGDSGPGDGSGGHGADAIMGW
jgi:hypothetical protein